MTFIEQEKDKRQHKRYDISSGAFALLKWNGSEVLGSIKDISTGGLCLSHIDDNEDLEALSRIRVKLISEKICYENFIGRDLCTTNKEDDFTTAMVKMKRRGIEFGRLNDELQLQLKEFINTLEKE